MVVVLEKKRNFGHVENRKIRTEINKDNIVSDLFYFLLFTPLDHGVGILMVQGYSEIKISDILKVFLKDYFKKTGVIKSDFVPYIPCEFKDKFKDEATFKSYKFSTGWQLDGSFEDAIPNDYELQFKIEIIDNNKKVPIQKLEALKNFIEQITLKIKGDNGKQRKLEDFSDKKIKVQNKAGKELDLDLDNEDGLRPIILLETLGIKLDDNGILDFKKLDIFCRNQLEEMKKQILPTYAIDES